MRVSLYGQQSFMKHNFTGRNFIVLLDSVRSACTFESDVSCSSGLGTFLMKMNIATLIMEKITSIDAKPIDEYSLLTRLWQPF